MPGSMCQRTINVAPASGVVHEDHEADGCTAKNIQRIVALAQSGEIWAKCNKVLYLNAEGFIYQKNPFTDWQQIILFLPDYSYWLINNSIEPKPRFKK